MKPFLTISALLSLLVPMLAAADEELDRLRASYEAAVARAVQPARENYAKALNRVAESRSKQGDLAGALGAKTALEQLDAASTNGAEDVEPAKDDELGRLRSAYGDATERVTGPLRETYLRELNKIVQARTRNSDLQGALVAKAEVERIAEEVARKNADPLEALFVGKTWVSQAGTAFTFAKDGKCIREAGGDRRNGTWRRRGSVVISGIDGAPQETRYFRFVSKTEAYYGNGENSINLPVTQR